MCFYCTFTDCQLRSDVFIAVFLSNEFDDLHLSFAQTIDHIWACFLIHEISYIPQKLVKAKADAIPLNGYIELPKLTHLDDFMLVGVF